MKCYVTRASDDNFYSVVECDHLENCLGVLRTFGYPFVVSFITDDDRHFDIMGYDDDGYIKLFEDKERTEAYESCDFEVMIYDGYIE